jgi:hypothetical protein
MPTLAAKLTADLIAKASTSLSSAHALRRIEDGYIHINNQKSFSRRRPRTYVRGPMHVVSFKQTQMRIYQINVGFDLHGNAVRMHRSSLLLKFIPHIS